MFVESADHNSQILFLEQWQLAKGKNITSNEMAPWRRQFMSNLVNAFDFENPNYTAVTFNNAEVPVTNYAGNYMGTVDCLNQYGGEQPPVPYNQSASTVLAVEVGYKKMRDNATEGRFNVFIDKNTGLALTVSNINGTNRLTTTEPSPGYANVTQGFFMQLSLSLYNAFTIRCSYNSSLHLTTPTQPLLATQSQLNATGQQSQELFTGAYTVPLLQSNQCESFTVGYDAEADGYYIMVQVWVNNPNPGFFLAVAKNGAVTWSTEPSYFDLYAVTYENPPNLAA